MEKSKSSAVFLTQRDEEFVGQTLKRLDWDKLVDEVFQQEVDQFFIESGIQSLYNGENKSTLSNSSLYKRLYKSVLNQSSSSLEVRTLSLQDIYSQTK